MKPFVHLIMSRVNVRSNSDSGVFKRKSDDEWTKWVEKYFYLFENYCYPSLEKQTNMDFKWFCYFDKSTTDKDRVNKFKLITPVYNYGDFNRNGIYQEIKKRGVEYIITTRFDIDDTYHEDMVKLIQDSFEQRDFIINPTIGYTRLIDIKNEVSKDIKFDVRKRIFPDNYPTPFISLVEKYIPDQPLKTVLHKKHAAMASVFPIKVLKHPKGDGLFIQNIHGSNASNKFMGSKCGEEEEKNIKKKFHTLL